MRIRLSNLAAGKDTTERNTVLEAHRLGFSEGIRGAVAAIWEDHDGITVNLWGSFVVGSDQLSSAPAPPVYLVLWSADEVK